MCNREHHIIISLASNEQQAEHLAKAREQLERFLGNLHFTAEHWTDPIHSHRRERYLNQLCRGTTTMSANRLNEVLKEIELRLGRTRNDDGIVAIDLDLLQYDEERYHQRDWERDYVKNLLNEL